MKNHLVASLVQTDLRWENPESNLYALERSIVTELASTDLIILPETFSTGFTMNSREFAESPDGKTASWMMKVARLTGSCIAGSFICREGGIIFNRLLLMGPDGPLGHYNKRHLFRMGRENESFSPGKERVIMNLGEFRLLPQICYDLRFPVFARNRNDYDVMFYVANWPASRHQVWETLLRARAIENQAWVIGVNRTGMDGEGMDHLGGSCVVDPMGKIVGILGKDPGILQYSLDLDFLRDFRERFPVWKDADSFRMTF